MLGLIATIGFIFVLNGLNRPQVPVHPPQPQTLSIVSETPKPEVSMENCAWLPWWDFENAESEFLRSGMKIMSPFIYSLNEDGLIEAKLPNTPEIFDDYRDQFTIIPTISNDFDAERVSVILNNTDNRGKHINDISNLVTDNGYDGIDLDYEYLKVEDKQAYNEFAKLLSEKLKENNKQLIITVHAKTSDNGVWHGAEALDWPELSKYADKIRIMAYDYNSSESNPGPIAPINWIKEVANYASSVIPREKAILGLGLYGYHWKENATPAEQIMINVVEELKGNLDNMEENFDEDAQAPSITYNNGTIWYENKDSFSQKISVAQENFSGMCIWRLGDTPDELLKLLSE